MNSDYFEQQLFTKQDYTETSLTKGEYDNCNFRDCNFSGSDCPYWFVRDDNVFNFFSRYIFETFFYLCFQDFKCLSAFAL